MDSKQLVKYWLESSDNDYKTMLSMFKSEHYSWALFVGHLSLEKLLKGLYAKVHIDNPHAPKIHDLLMLAKKCNLKVDIEKCKQMDIINGFNLNTRYMEYKNEFYKMCTKTFTKNQIDKIEELRLWLRKILMDK